MFSNELNAFDNFLNLSRDLLSNFHREELAIQLVADISEDMSWMHHCDPASRDKKSLESRTTTIAVAYYRLANLVLEELEDAETAGLLHRKAISETKIDIHPRATIAVPFAIDHGINTVIGETCDIGNNCLLLNNVTLGSRDIGPTAGDALRGEKRHPSLGNNVIVGGNVRILGPVKIGDNTRIGSYALITTDIPSNSEVHCVAKLQIIKQSKESMKQPPVILSVYPPRLSNTSDDILYITGQGFENDITIELVGYRKNEKSLSEEEVIQYPANYIQRTYNVVMIKVNRATLSNGVWDIRATNSDGQWFSLVRCLYYQDE